MSVVCVLVPCPCIRLWASVRPLSLAKADLDNGGIERVRALRDRLWTGLQAELDELYLNGSWEHRLPNNLNVSLPMSKANQ